MKTTAMKRFVSGLAVGGLGIILILAASARGWVTGGLVDGVSVAILLLGLFFAFTGIMLFMDGRTIAKQGDTPPYYHADPQPRAHTSPSHPPHPAGESHAHRPPAFPDQNDDEMDIEEPSKKECPGCHKYVFKDSRVCRFCGHSFPITYILKIFRHKDPEKNKHLTALMAKKLDRGEQEVGELLESGLRLSYSTREQMETNRTKFEHFGCPVQTYEKVGRA